MPLLRPLQDASGIDEVLAEFADLAVPLLRAETRALAGAIRKGDVTGWAAFDGEGAGAVGALIYRRRETRAEVTFIHVLGAMQGRGLEEALVAGAVSGFRAAGLREVYCDCVIAGDPQPVRHGFSLLGFEEFPKSLMVVDLGPGTAVSCRGLPGLAIAAWDERYAEQAAAVVHRAHAARTDPHRESPDLRSALAEVTTTTRLPAFNRAASSVAVNADPEGGLRGVALVTNPGPDIGFLTELAVDPGFRRRGLGTALVSRALAVCHEQARTALYLVVSDGNAAASGLYRKSGFHPAMPLLSCRLRLCPAVP